MSEKAERCPGNCRGGLVEVEWWDDWGDKWMPCPVCGYEDDEGALQDAGVVEPVRESPLRESTRNVAA